MDGKIDWTGYSRVHRDRRNLVIHALAVPRFVGSVVVLVVSLIRGNYLAGIIAPVGGVYHDGVAGRGHAPEAHAPAPFAGPAEFLKRWFAEQFLIFPLYLVTGRWLRQFRGDGGGAGSAA